MLNWSSRRNTNPVVLIVAMTDAMSGAMSGAMTGAMTGAIELVAIPHLLGHSVLSVLLVVMF